MADNQCFIAISRRQSQSHARILSPIERGSEIGCRKFIRAIKKERLLLLEKVIKVSASYGSLLYPFWFPHHKSGSEGEVSDCAEWVIFSTWRARFTSSMPPSTWSLVSISDCWRVRLDAQNEREAGHSFSPRVNYRVERYEATMLRGFTFCCVPHSNFGCLRANE